MASKARLGTPRAPIEITQTSDGVRIEMPVRRTRLNWVLGVSQLAIAALGIVFYGGAAIWTIVVLADGGPSPLLPFMIVVMLLLMFFLYRAYPFIAVAALYSLFGTQVVTVEHGKVSVSRRVGRHRASSAGPYTLQFDTETSVLVDVAEDRRGRNYVRLRQGAGRTGHEMSFGYGYLSRSQADQIAELLWDEFRGRVEPAHPADGVGSEQQGSGAVHR